MKCSTLPILLYDKKDLVPSCFTKWSFFYLYILQILALAHNSADIAARVHAVIDKFADRGLRSLAVAKQVIRRHPSPLFLE
jgi:hypothetical protein